MKTTCKFLFVLFICIVTKISFAMPALDAHFWDLISKADKYLKQPVGTAQAWKVLLKISNDVSAHPSYDDGAFAEGYSDITIKLLGKPWKYAEPYILGTSNSASFIKFILRHIDATVNDKDLKAAKQNISQHCHTAQYPICSDLLKKIDSSLAESK